ncbi:MAG: hypothetical protein EOP48_02405, partial [Sphingobacteriales bacterium]
MNTSHILEIAKTIVPDLQAVEKSGYKNIYKGTLNINQRIAGVYYFDLSNAAHENFEEFQETLLSDEFYSNSGNMQWNYYLFMLNDKLNEQQRIAIEKNDRYARKFVLDEREFVDFFQFEDSEKKMLPNLVATWKERLEDVDLQELYTDAQYTEVFDRFYADTTRKTAEVKLKKSAEGADVINFIDSVSLKPNYRRQPEHIRDFKFRQVNLLQGINGVGKTSVLEAIELMLCGYSLRNPSHVNPNGCIEARYNGKAELHRFRSSDTSLYNARDLLWYSSPAKRSDLYSSFNRFNYFNADAAQAFANKVREEEIRPALINIVLGPEFSYIEERCKKMLDRIRRERNILEKSLADSSSEIKKSESVISSNLDAQNQNFIKQKVLENTQAVRFLNDPTIGDLDVAKLEETNNQLQVLLSYFVNNDFRYNSVLDLEKQEAGFEARKLAVGVLLEQLKVINQEVAEKVKQQKVTEQECDLLKKALRYLFDARLLRLDGIEAIFSQKRFELTRIDSVRSRLKELKLHDYKLEIEVDQLVSDLRENLGIHKKEINRLELSIEHAMQHYGKVARVVKEIKASGSAFLKLEPNVHSCPLCQADYSREVLEERIMLISGYDDLPITQDFQGDRLKLDSEQAKAAAIDKKLKDVETLKETYLQYFSLVNVVPDLNEMVIDLTNVISTYEYVIAEVQSLEEIRQMGHDLNLSEKELREIKFKVQQSFGDKMSMDLDKRGIFDDQLVICEKKSEGFRIDLEGLQKRRLAKSMEIKQFLDIPSEDTMVAAEATRALELESASFQLFRDYFGRLRALVGLEDHEKISDLSAHSNLLRENVRSLIFTLQGEVRVNEAKANLEDHQKRLKKNTRLFERFDKAFQCLKDLTSGVAEQEMEDFFERNFAEIIDIFKAIHVPKEFVDIKYIKGAILLVDANGEERGISKISTGQRSALALSIFLSMNKKLEHGPNIIMFDDPVAFIDDLNALSFLD